MGVIFFSSLTMLCGGALFKRARERRRFLKRYANRLAKIVENNAAIQAHFLKKSERRRRAGTPFLRKGNLRGTVVSSGGKCH